MLTRTAKELSVRERRTAENAPEPRNDDASAFTAQSHVKTAQLAVQRKPADSAEAAAPTPSATKSPIVADGTPSGPGEMQRSTFMAALRPMVTEACDAELAAAGQTADQCPYIQQWLSYYDGRSADDIYRAIQGYAAPPPAANASALLAAVVARAQLAVRRWVNQGDEEDTAAPESGENSDQPGRASSSDDDAPAVQAKGANSGSAPGVHNPGAVLAHLRMGHSLETGVRSQMETAFGRSFSDVRIHTDNSAASLSNSMDARAFTVGRSIGFATGEYQPDTLPGKALIAHELAHTIQQSHGTASGERGMVAENADLEEEADRAAFLAVSSLGESDRFAPNARGGLRLQRCKKQKPEEKKKTVAKPGSTFSEVRAAIAKAPDEPARKAALEQGIQSARTWGNQLYTLGGNQEPIKSIRERISGESRITDTGLKLDPNPFIGVTKDRIEAAYHAWYEGGRKGKEPWVLLAVWAKEGEETPVTGEIKAKNAADAKAIWRAKYFWSNLGTDYYMAHTESATGENTPDFDPTKNQTVLKKTVDKQVKAGRLPRDISGEIDGELTATEVSPDAGTKRFNVSPSPRFYVLALMLVDAYYRENEEAVAADSQLAGPGGAVDPAMVYAHWNLGPARFGEFVKSAESHRQEPQYKTNAGASPGISEWAFHRPIKSGEWDQPRRNAVRLAYKIEIYRLAYEGGF